MIADAPKWLSQDFYNVMGKAADTASPTGPRTSAAPDIDVDDIKEMLRSLLADRFKLAVHQEDRPFDSYTLLATGPRMKKADTANRPRAESFGETKRIPQSKCSPARTRP